MQSLRPHPVADYTGIGHAVRQIVQVEGIRTPFRGLSVVVTGAGPAHALYFAAYETIKRSMSPRNPGNSSIVNCKSQLLLSMDVGMLHGFIFQAS